MCIFCSEETKIARGTDTEGLRKTTFSSICKKLFKNFPQFYPFSRKFKNLAEKCVKFLKNNEHFIYVASRDIFEGFRNLLPKVVTIAMKLISLHMKTIGNTR